MLNNLTDIEIYNFIHVPYSFLHFAAASLFIQYIVYSIGNC